MTDSDRTRRSNGEGSKPFRRPGRKGLYQYVRTTDPITGEKGRTLISAPTPKALTDKRRALLNAVDSGLALARNGKNITVREYAEDWQETHLPVRDVTPGTIGHYRGVIKNHIIPVLGGRKLSSMRAADVELVDKRLLALGRSASLRRSTNSLLHMMFETAVRDKHLAANPCARVSRPKEKRRRQPQYTPAQIRTLTEAAKDIRLIEHIVVLLTWTALRIGEAVALRWQDLDLDAEVPMLWVAGTAAVDERGRIYRKDLPKDDEPRPVPLMPQAVAALKAQRVKQTAERLKAGEFWQANDLVFATEIGTMTDPRNLRRPYRKLIKKTKLTGSFHALRRSTATMLNEAGVDLAVIAAILGHSSTRITETHYVIVNMDPMTKAMNQLGDYWAAIESKGA